MSERSLRGNVVAALKPLHAVPVENPVWPGTPDVSYAGGWIELKQVEQWPARAETVLKIDHYTPQQRIFAVKERRAGGACWMLLQVGRRELLLFDGAVAARFLSKTWRRLDCIENAVLYTDQGIRSFGLVEALRDGRGSGD